MTKFICLLLTGFLVSNLQLQAQGVRFVENKTWSDVLTLAKKENKLIFLDAYATWCGPCKYMQKNVFTLESVGKLYNSSFINVKMNMEEGEGVKLAEKYGLTAFPTLYFINGNGELVHRNIGALKEDEFISLGKDALNPAKQFFTLKEKAKTGKLEPAAFHTWIHEANENEEEDVDDVIKAYLAATTFPMNDKELLTIILDHGVVLPVKYIDYLYKNKATVIEKTGKSEESFSTTLFNKIKGYAIDQTAKEVAMDFASYTAILNKYPPINAKLETQKIKVKYYCYKKEYTQGLNELAICIENTSLGLPVVDLATMLVEYAPFIVVRERENEFIKKITDYKLLPQDQHKGYGKDLALLAIYSHLKNQEKINALSSAILNNDQAPEQIKKMATKLVEGEEEEE